jgi:uncharacterized membrane protein YbhN (UPF0104 family)
LSHLLSRNSRISIPRLLGSLIALALLVYLLTQQGWREIGQALRGIGWWPMLISLGLTLLSRLAVAARWHVLLRGAGGKVTYGQTLRLTFAGLFASNFLPTTIGGDVVRLAGGFLLDLDRAVCAASLVVDRLVGMAGMAMPLPVGLAAVLGRPPAGPEETQGNASPAIVLMGVSSNGWLSSLRRRGREFLRRVLEALTLWMRRPQALLNALVMTWGHMLFLFASIWFLLRRMGEQTSFPLVAGLWTLVYFITLVPISINGLGLQEVSLTFVYVTFAGVSMPNALTLAVLLRTLYVASSLPGAVFLPGILPSARQLTSNTRGEAGGGEAG